MWALSGGRISKEEEEFILDELPFPRAVMYWHCKQSENPFYWTVDPFKKPAGAAVEQADRIQERALAEETGEAIDPGVFA